MHGFQMYPERVVFVSVETVDGLHDGTFQVLDGLEIIIVNRGALEVAPESFDEVEIRRIGGVPNADFGFRIDEDGRYKVL